MDDKWVLIDANTGLHVGWYFWLRVLDEVNRSARYGPPFGLLILDAHTPPGAPAKLFDEACGRVPAAIRSTDLAGLIGCGQVGVLLPHQEGEAAETARDRILERLANLGPKGISWASRLLCYPADAAEISILLTGERPGHLSDGAESASMPA
jgi:GGDEF domain-containing protein